MRHVILDIETVGIDNAAEFLPAPEPIEPPDLSTITAAKNLVDPAKVAADIEKRKQAAVEDYQKRVDAAQAKFASAMDRAGLDADLGRIVCFGWRFSDSDHVGCVSCATEAAEVNALGYVFGQIRGCNIVTFNGRRFDLPFLMRRALYLGVTHQPISMDRYRSPHVDLYQKLTYDGAIEGHSLSFYAKRFGIGHDDTITGKDVARLVREATAADTDEARAAIWQQIEHHCKSDVLATYAIAQRMGIFEYAPDEVATGAF